MRHNETIRILQEAKTAVMFLHGIVGTPDHFRDLIPLEELVSTDWSVYNLRLPGHGNTVEDFGRSSMRQWKHYVWDVFEKLSQTHEQIILVGHSMGTLFSIQLALEHPEKVPFLFLIAVPMRPGVRLFGAINCLKLAFGGLREDRPIEAATMRVCGVKTTRKLWMYYRWIPRFLELFREIRLTEKRLSCLSVPCVAYQSRRDELVRNKSKRVLERSGVMQVHELSESTHFYYAPEDQITVREVFLNKMNGTAAG